MLRSFFLVILLGAAPAASPTASPKPPAQQAAAPASGFEITFSEALLGSLLTAAAPIEEDVEQEIGMLGLTRTVQVHIKLTDPVVRVQKDGIKVTMNYHLTDPSGFVNQRGVATPEMQIVPVPSKKIFEGRLVRSGVMLPGGIELPLDNLVDPIEIPSVIPQDIDVGSKVLAAEARATDIVLEDGRVRVRGTVTFKPKAAAAAPAPAASPASPPRPK